MRYGLSFLMFTKTYDGEYVITQHGSASAAAMMQRHDILHYFGFIFEIYSIHPFLRRCSEFKDIRWCVLNWKQFTHAYLNDFEKFDWKLLLETIAIYAALIWTVLIFFHKSDEATLYFKWSRRIRGYWL